MMTHKEACDYVESLPQEDEPTDGYKAVEWLLNEYCSARGLVMVPKEPTERMCQSAFAHTAFPKGTWSVMLVSAPDPFKDAE